MKIINKHTKTTLQHVKKGSIEPLPPFTNLEEEANFWDTHSMLDDIDDGTLIGFHVAQKDTSLVIPFPKEEIQQLKEQAFQKGIAPVNLVRTWLREKLASSTSR